LVPGLGFAFFAAQTIKETIGQKNSPGRREKIRSRIKKTNGNGKMITIN